MSEEQQMELPAHWGDRRGMRPQMGISNPAEEVRPPEVVLRDELREDFTEVYELLLVKRDAYGSDNIAYTGMEGISIRLLDKAFRLYNLVRTPRLTEESTLDTLRDIQGYAAIGTRLTKGGTW